MNLSVVNEKIIKKIYKRRFAWSHKGDFGRVLVIGGNQDYTGSPGLVALAAYRAGADLVKILAPKRAADACSCFSPELIAIPYQKNNLDDNAMGNIISLSENVDAVTIGNGMGNSSEQRELVNDVLKNLRKRIIVDADAIKILDKSLLDRNMIITPNSYEFSLLSGAKPSTDVNERIKSAVSFARQYHTNLLLKGHVDIITDGDNVMVNKTNSVYMTKAGTGDVLSGICAALIAQGNDAMDAAAGAAFINGHSGRAVARQKRESLSPVDIIDNIYDTITKSRIQ